MLRQSQLSTVRATFGRTTRIDIQLAGDTLPKIIGIAILVIEKGEMKEQERRRATATTNSKGKTADSETPRLRVTPSDSE